MRLLCRLTELLGGFIGLLPRFLARPVMYVIAFVYFEWKCLLAVFLPSVLAGALAPYLIDNLPPGESIPAVVVLAALVVALWWQWWRAEGFGERISKLEDEVEEVTVYVRADGNMIED